MPIAPYGGKLVNRIPDPQDAGVLRERAATLACIGIPSHTLSDLFLLAVGAYSPLEGFMTQAEYDGVLDAVTLPSGLPWSVPVTLSATSDEARRFAAGDEVALVAEDGAVAAVIRVNEVFGWDREREAQAVYRTRDRKHPGVARLDTMGDVLIAGPIQYLYPNDISGFPALHRTPAETRLEFAQRGWNTVVAFQTRNPVHRAHEYLQKCALEMVDGLLLHPIVGDTKSDDVPASVRVQCYEVLLDLYYPRGRVVLSVLPAAMRYAGPREAIFHAIMRRNYGCTHFIVGRDHAGVGDYYGTYDAQRIFETIDLERLGIRPIMFEHAYWCKSCGQMVSPKTCPHDAAHHVFLSGTKVRAMLTAGERPPVEFTRSEVADVLVRAYRHAAGQAGSTL